MRPAIQARVCTEGSPPEYSLYFPKWEALIAHAVGGADASAALVDFAGVAEVLVVVAVLVLASQFKRRPAPFFKTACPELESAPAELQRAHSRYVWILKALRRRRFAEGLPQALAQADALVTGCAERIERARRRVPSEQVAAIDRMQQGLSRARDAVDAVVAALTQRVFGYAATDPLEASLTSLCMTGAAPLETGVRQRALVVLSIGVVCVDFDGARTALLFDDGWVQLVFGVPWLVLGCAFFATGSLRDGAGRAVLTVATGSGLAVLLWLVAAQGHCWWPSLAPVTLSFAWWALSRAVHRVGWRPRLEPCPE